MTFDNESPFGTEASAAEAFRERQKSATHERIARGQLASVPSPDAPFDRARAREILEEIRAEQNQIPEVRDDQRIDSLLTEFEELLDSQS